VPCVRRDRSCEEAYIVGQQAMFGAVPHLGSETVRWNLLGVSRMRAGNGMRVIV